MSKRESMRFKVSISSGEVEIYEHLKEFGPYYRSRRLMELARLGFSIQKGSAVVAQHLMPTDIAARPTNKSLAAPQQPHYIISENAASQVSEMFESLDNWGTA